MVSAPPKMPVGNAIGPWLGGLAIAADWGWTATGWVGVALALGGLVVRAVSWRLEGCGARNKR